MTEVLSKPEAPHRHPGRTRPPPGYRDAMEPSVVEVVGVYDADGGVVGELSYVIGHLLHRTDCSLCDVTHGSLRRKPQWDAMVARLPVRVRLVHRNETSADERPETVAPSRGPTRAASL